MISTWQDVSIWLIILALVIVGIFVIDFIRGWWSFQKKREKLIEEIRRRRE